MTNYPQQGPVRLRTNLADSALVRAFKAGEVKSDLVSFDFSGPKVAHQGFKPMVREGKFDAGELAIVTYLQALAYGKPLVLLPFVAVGRFQHHCMLINAARGHLAPKGIEGRRIGVRSYTQTTGVWVRGVLQHDYGVDLDKVTWVTFEDSHLAEHRDPANVERAPDGKELEQMVVEGELDGAILTGEMAGEPRVQPLLPNPHAAAGDWFARHRTVPINHMFVVDRALSEQRPDVVSEIYRLLRESKAKANLPDTGPDPVPLGVEANRRSLELVIQYAFEQKIIPRRFEVDELFDATTRALG